MPLSSVPPRWRVLVIDDSQIARTAIATSLRDAGFEVFELATAIGSTREVLRHRIACVVIDVNMPSVRGDNLARLFRANPRFRNLRLVLVTGDRVEDFAGFATAAGADAWLDKTEVAGELPNLVRQLLATVPAPPGA